MGNLNENLIEETYTLAGTGSSRIRIDLEAKGPYFAILNNSDDDILISYHNPSVTGQAWRETITVVSKDFRILPKNTTARYLFVQGTASDTVTCTFSNTRIDPGYYGKKSVSGLVDYGSISGNGYGNDGDPLNVAGTPVTVNFAGSTPGRPLEHLSFTANVDIALTINYEDQTAPTVTILKAGEFFTHSDPRKRIDSITYENNVAGQTFEIRGVGY